MILSKEQVEIIVQRLNKMPDHLRNEATLFAISEIFGCMSAAEIREYRAKLMVEFKKDPYPLYQSVLLVADGCLALREIMGE